MSNRKVFTNISKLYTLSGGIRVKEELDQPKIVDDAYMIVDDEIIVDIGKMNELAISDEEVIDLDNKIVTPGFVDAHSHLVYGGNRVNEYALKIKGASYMDIYHAGGGIHSTVEATRKASFEELYEKAEKTVMEMLSCGVTTLEAKSGYGLNEVDELKQLYVVKKLNETTPMDLVSTFMPAHALSKEYKDAYDYFDLIIEQVLPRVVDEHLAEYMDCFLEKGVFDGNESRYILEAGKKAGLKIKIHVDEMEDIGGVDVGVDLHATSLEHCMVTNEKNMVKMAQAGIVAVILPATSFNLGKDYANVQMMKEKGVILALSNDYNPGSSPCSDSIWMARIASRGCKLTPNEVLSMMTINSAKALDREDLIGSLEVGKLADFIVFDAMSFDEVIASLGSHLIDSVYKRGIRIC
ncbi:MAG: imidazolonepropionase [Traorella sp.]